MKGNSNIQLTSEIYSKCLKQQSDINSQINEVINGDHKSGALDKVKQKVLEKLENLENSIIMMEEMNSTTRQDIWSKKIENMRISYKGLVRLLEDSVAKQRKKHKGTGASLFSADSKMSGDSLTYLSQEKESWNKINRVSLDIEAHSRTVSQELEDQAGFLGRVQSKVGQMYNKLGVANTMTGYLIRRGRGDTYLCLFLGLLTIGIIYYVYYHVKPKLRL